MSWLGHSIEQMEGSKEWEKDFTEGRSRVSKKNGYLWVALEEWNAFLDITSVLKKIFKIIHAKKYVFILKIQAKKTNA